jgi:hypothetical protein
LLRREKKLRERVRGQLQCIKVDELIETAQSVALALPLVHGGCKRGLDPRTDQAQQNPVGRTVA